MTFTSTFHPTDLRLSKPANTVCLREQGGVPPSEGGNRLRSDGLTIWCWWLVLLFVSISLETEMAHSCSDRDCSILRRRVCFTVLCLLLCWLFRILMSNFYSDFLLINGTILYVFCTQFGHSGLRWNGMINDQLTSSSKWTMEMEAKWGIKWGEEIMQILLDSSPSLIRLPRSLGHVNEVSRFKDFFKINYI